MGSTLLKTQALVLSPFDNSSDLLDVVQGLAYLSRPAFAGWERFPYHNCILIKIWITIDLILIVSNSIASTI